jgi:hypothetical protein
LPSSNRRLGAAGTDVAEWWAASLVSQSGGTAISHHPGREANSASRHAFLLLSPAPSVRMECAPFLVSRVHRTDGGESRG